MMKKYEIFICLGSFLIYERSKKDDDDEPKFLCYRKTDTGFIFSALMSFIFFISKIKALVIIMQINQAISLYFMIFYHNEQFEIH